MSPSWIKAQRRNREEEGQGEMLVSRCIWIETSNRRVREATLRRSYGGFDSCKTSTERMMVHSANWHTKLRCSLNGNDVSNDKQKGIVDQRKKEGRSEIDNSETIRIFTEM